MTTIQDITQQQHVSIGAAAYFYLKSDPDLSDADAEQKFKERMAERRENIAALVEKHSCSPQAAKRILEGEETEKVLAEDRLSPPPSPKRRASPGTQKRPFPYNQTGNYQQAMIAVIIDDIRASIDAANRKLNQLEQLLKDM